MLRLSNRTDEGRLYFMVVNDSWKLLKPRSGETLTLFVEFPYLQRDYGSAGMIVQNVDGRMGFTADAFPTDDIFRALSTEKGFRLSGLFKSDKKPTVIEEFDSTGAAVAITLLVECSQEYFPAK
jgi:hypothetical protein